MHSDTRVATVMHGTHACYSLMHATPIHRSANII